MNKKLKKRKKKIDKDNINNYLDNKEIRSEKLEDVLNKMKNNINKMKIHRPTNEKLNNKNPNNLSKENVNFKNNIINTDNNNIIINIISSNDNNIINDNNNLKKFLNKDIIKCNSDNENISDNSIKYIKKENKDKEDTNNIILDKNLNINDNLIINQELKGIKLQNTKENKNINILQNLKGISNQNIKYGSTLMSNVSYSSFLSFKNKKVKFVNLNSSINQNSINKSKQEEFKDQEKKDKEIINQKEQEKIMKNILERLGGGEQGTGAIHENVNEENSAKKIVDLSSSSNKEEYSKENDFLLFHISKQYEKNKNKNNLETNSSKNNKLDKIDNKIKVNYIKCTLSFLDKGKAVFVTENDDIFYIPSALINKEMKVGNSYSFQIEKINDSKKRMLEIENIQNKYNEWKI